MPVVLRPLWAADSHIAFVSYLPACVAKQGWQHLTGSVVLATGRDRNGPKIVYTGNTKLEDAENVGNNLTFARKGN